MTAVEELDELRHAPASGSPGGASWFTRSVFRLTLGRIVLLAALVAWLIGLQSIKSAAVSQYGLLATASPLLVVSMIMTGLGFVFAVRADDRLGAWCGVAMSIATLRLTMTLGTADPFYSWTYKHIAVADYIQQTGTVARDVDIYHHWDAFFAASAWLSDVSGISVITMAHWFTPAVYVLVAVIFYGVARAWNLSPMTALVAVFLQESLDWIAQGYYSPQFTAYLMSLGFLGLLGVATRSGRLSRMMLSLMILLFAAITITHELTPYWLLLLVGTLTVLRRLKPWWLLGVLAGIAIMFLAMNLGVVQQFGLLSGGDIVSNARPNIQTHAVGGQFFSSSLTRFVTLAMVVSSALILLWSLIRRRSWLVPSVVAFASFGLLLGQNYGGEAIFRVVLYSLPGCAITIAPVFRRLTKLKITVVPIALLAAAVVGCTGQGLFGPWFAYNMPAEVVNVSTRLMTANAPPTYITALAVVWPERSSADYVDYARWNTRYDATIVDAKTLVGSHFDNDADYNTFMNIVMSRGNVHTFFVVTQAMRVYDWYFGILPYDAVPNLEARMAEDPRWKSFYASPDVHVYELATSGN